MMMMFLLPQERERRAQTKRRTTMMILLMSSSSLSFLMLLFSQNPTVCDAFSSTPVSFGITNFPSHSTIQQQQRQLQLQRRRQKQKQHYSTRDHTLLFFSQRDGDQTEATAQKQKQQQEDEERESLSNIDARVLQSMLQDTKLDLQTEDNMRKLLERGTTKKKKQRPRVTEMEDTEFQSTVLKKLSDTKLWQALKRRADDALETVSIYVNNRVERDAQLLASLGIFIGDRIRRDIARALPSQAPGVFGGRIRRQQGRLLSNNSSYTEMQDLVTKAKEQEEEERRLRQERDSYDEFNTPLDEIRSVTQSIRDILRGETMTSSSSSSSSSPSSPRRSLRNVAQGGSSRRVERQQRAYQKRKATSFKREQEVVDVGRAVGSIADAAWEMKRELEVETNQPGYKTETIRTAIEAGAETTARVIAAAREDPGSWRKQLGQALFGRRGKEEQQDNVLQAAQTMDVSAVADNTIDVREPMVVDMDSVKEPTVGGMDQFDVTYLDTSGEVDVEKFIQAEIDKIDLKFEIPEIKIPDVEIPIVPEEPQLIIPELSVPIELIDEREIALERLKECIDTPETTWLTSDILETLNRNMDERALREVVTAMICARDDLEASSQEMLSSSQDLPNTKTMGSLMTDLRQVKSSVDMVNSLAANAAGFAAADRLRNILYGIDEGEVGVRPTLEILDEIEQTYARETKDIEETAKNLHEAAIEYRQRIIEEREAAILERESLIAEAEAEREQLIAEAEIALEEAKAEAIQRGIEKAEEYRILQEEALERGKQAAGAARVEEIEAQIRDLEAATVDDYIVESPATVVTDDEARIEELEARIRETEESQRTGVVTDDPMSFETATPPKPDFVEVEILEPAVVQSVQSTEVFANGDTSASVAELVVDDDSAVAVEVLSSSEDIEDRFGGTKVAMSMDELEEEEEEMQEPNMFVKFSLRGLDILLVVVEKVVTLLPDLAKSGILASQRIEEVGRGGMGRKGWKKISNIQSGEKRY